MMNHAQTAGPARNGVTKPARVRLRVMEGNRREMNDANWMKEEMDARARFRAELSAQPQEHKALMVCRYAQLNRYASKGQIVMAGSSLMEDFPVAELMPLSSDGLRIYNRGIGGMISSELIVSIETLILDLEPSRLFINIGSNDIAAEGFLPERLIGNYEEILARVRERVPDCLIHLMAYYPVNADEAFPGIDDTARAGMFAHRTNAAIQAANRAVESLAARSGCLFVDANRGLADECGNLRRAYTLEGIHMYPEAYAVILDNLRPYL